MKQRSIKVSRSNLTLAELVLVARYDAQVELAPELYQDIDDSCAAVQKMVDENAIVYGITTGFGSLASVAISPEDTAALQENLLKSHACGVGKPLSVAVVRAMLLLRVKSLSWGYSGIRRQTIEALIAMLNAGLTPIVPEQGSLGASGDLCPLAHMVLPLIGEGEAILDGEVLPGKLAMARAGIATVKLTAKEGLALINGTQCMTAIGALTVADAQYLLTIAEITAALTLQALNGRRDAFSPLIHNLRPQAGQQISADLMMRHTEGSAFCAAPQAGQANIRVQDAYSLRCIAQVHGASRDAIAYVRQIIETEMNSVTDNPLIFREGDGVQAISGGNFHGQPVALAMDFLSIAVAELANIAERRIERMVNKDLSNGLPAYLVNDTKAGLNSGLMILQYSAAALVSENKVLAHPASVDSISSSNNQEDHVSMGTIAARQAAAILENTQQVIAMELLAATAAIDLRCQKADWSKGQQLWLGPKPTIAGLSPTTKQVYDKVRQSVSFMTEDRIIATDIKKVAQLITNQELVAND